jgi:hypothetical protein
MLKFSLSRLECVIVRSEVAEWMMSRGEGEETGLHPVGSLPLDGDRVFPFSEVRDTLTRCPTSRRVNNQTFVAGRFTLSAFVFSLENYFLHDYYNCPIYIHM